MTAETATVRPLNPAVFESKESDAETRRVFRATIDWFETKGKTRLLAESHTDEWYADFIDFLARERVLATLLTPARETRAWLVPRAGLVAPDDSGARRQAPRSGL